MGRMEDLAGVLKVTLRVPVDPECWHWLCGASSPGPPHRAGGRREVVEGSGRAETPLNIPGCRDA